ncbi:uncharacterized protein LOC129003422 [Macrosteles quadrilineatus]|uniref:uncharacterized protein LOC129003422 n=1 Tax=Macrosteles quadrilineatus TaxID=74068 RepID=UPI0023E29B56|nr:uncharacterized protein LOC129003422 [Macrosteles quadrilineatus]
MEYKTSRKRKYDGFVVGCIRKIIHSFFATNTPPTLTAVLEKLNDDPDLPEFKRTTLWRLLKENGFCYEKRKRQSLLLERDDLIVWRHSYLRSMRRFRKEKRNIVFMDETWVNVGQATSKIWKDQTIKTPKDAFLAGLTTGLKDPTQRGPRFVIVHAGGENGFVEGAQLVFLAKKGTADFHAEMDADTYEKWFVEQLVPNVPPGTVVVIDNASYHSRKLEKVPNTKTKKEDIKNWLLDKNVTFPQDSLKKELLAEVQKIKHLFDLHAIDEIAKTHNIEIVRLPPYHCELNPIELVWSQVKRHVAANNKAYDVKLMEPLIDNAFKSVKNEQWMNYCKHVIDIENDMWKIDSLQDDVEPLIIHLSGSSSTEGDESSTSIVSAESGVVPLQ